MNKKYLLIIALTVYTIIALINFFVLDKLAIVYAFENFFLLFFLLYLSTSKLIKQAFQERASNTQEQINKAKKSHTAALKEHENIESKLSRADSDQKEYMDTIERNTENEKEQILKAAQDLSSKILKDTKQLAEQEAYKATQALKTEAAEQATKLAEQKIRGAMTPELHERLGQEFIYQIKDASTT